MIAELLNNDFNSVRDRLTNIRTVAAKPGSAGARFGGGSTGDDSPDAWVRLPSADALEFAFLQHPQQCHLGVER